MDVSKEVYQEAATAALESASESYSPYTKCPAGVALISGRGVHCGGIVENAAHNPTLQPLQAALINARIDGLTQYSDVRVINILDPLKRDCLNFGATWQCRKAAAWS